MKIIICLLAATHVATAAELPVGFASANQSFAIRSGNSFVNTSLDDYQGKILVVMMQTPWCPACITNGMAVGAGILSPFNASSRGALRGKNDHGIEIDSVMLSVEPAPEWDGTNSSFASTNGYEQWGLDANAQRLTPRIMLGYYRGGYPNGVNSSNLYDWGNDRRRVVVLNLVRNSASHGFRQIVINQNSFDSGDAAGARAMINAILPPPTTTSFAQWSAGFSFPTGTSGTDNDPDRDGCVNLLEFFHGTHPLQSASSDRGPELVRQEGILKLVYRRAKSIGGLTVEHRASANLGGWQILAAGSLNQTSTDLGNVDEITVSLPASVDPARFYQISVTLP